MNEVYCNDTAMNLAFTIESEELFPDTMINENNGIPLIYFDAGTEMPLSYNPDFKPNDPYLDGQMIDDHTYAGVLRIALEETKQNLGISEQYYGRSEKVPEGKGCGIRMH